MPVLLKVCILFVSPANAYAKLEAAVFLLREEKGWVIVINLSWAFDELGSVSSPNVDEVVEIIITSNGERIVF